MRGRHRCREGSVSGDCSLDRSDARLQRRDEIGRQDAGPCNQK